MKIAQVSPLYESVPPKLYGGTERVVYNIVEELINQGHEVTLFASGDSVTRARLVSPCRKALRLDKNSIDQFAGHFTMMEMVEKESPAYDIIHSHIDYMYFPLIRRMKVPHITTLHGRLDLPELKPLYQEYSDIPLVSISDSQRKPVAFVNWVGTVYHGILPDIYQLNPRQGSYLAYVGRISPEKRVDRAVEIAKLSGIPLKIAAKVDKVDADYFKSEIKHLLDDPMVEFLGEINEKGKQELLGNALGFLHPIDWPEPFGLGMIEAMACGTPVIAFACGSIPEVVDNGKTGFIVHTLAEAVDAVKKLHTIDRVKCREIFEKRFTAKRMVSDYLKIYSRIIEQARTKNIRESKLRI